MKLNIKLFATLKAKAQTNYLNIEINNELCSVKDLLVEISYQKPELESLLKSVLVAVNGEYAFPEQVLSGSDEIALFPPVSGG